MRRRSQRRSAAGARGVAIERRVRPASQGIDRACASNHVFRVTCLRPVLEARACGPCLGPVLGTRAWDPCLGPVALVGWRPGSRQARRDVLLPPAIAKKACACCTCAPGYEPTRRPLSHIIPTPIMSLVTREKVAIRSGRGQGGCCDKGSDVAGTLRSRPSGEAASTRSREHP